MTKHAELMQAIRDYEAAKKAEQEALSRLEKASKAYVAEQKRQLEQQR